MDPEKDNIDKSDNHGLSGKWALVANASGMTIVAVLLFIIYWDFRGIILADINFNRSDLANWRESVRDSHTEINVSVRQTATDCRDLSNRLESKCEQLHAKMDELTRAVRKANPNVSLEKGPPQ